MPRLVVNPGSPGAWEIELKPGDNFIGRGFSNDFKLNDPSVSGSHCQITIRENSVVIKDLHSTNGTYVERAPVQESNLKNGQVVHLGTVEMMFYSDGPAPTAGLAPSTPKVRIISTRATAPTQPRANSLSTAAIPPLPPPLPRATLAPALTRQAAPALMHQAYLARPGFFHVVWSSFGYPLKGDGVILLVTGTVFFSVLKAGKFFAAYAGLIGLVAIAILFVIGTGYLTCFLQRIITGTALGEEKMPDWPDVTDINSDVLGPFLQLAGVFFASFLPAILAAGWLTSRNPLSGWVFAAATVFGGLYFPMAFLAVAMVGTVFAVNPLAVVPPVFRMPLHYLFSCFLFGAVLVLHWAGAYFFPAFIQIRFVSSILMSFAQLYLLTVGVRVLGLLYWTNKEKFGWLSP